MVVRRSVRLDTGAINNLLHGRTGNVGRVMSGFASLATTEVRKTADERVQTRTGAYKRGIHSRLVSANKVEVEATAKHSIFLERGTRPHIIVPRREGGFLRFTVNGRVIYARSVNHPGTRPYNILRDGVQRAGRQLNRLARR